VPRLFQAWGTKGETEVYPAFRSVTYTPIACGTTSAGVRACVVVTCLAAVMIGGCSGDSGDGTDRPGVSTAVVRSVDEGGVEVVLTADRSELPFDERLSVSIEVVASPEVAVNWGDYLAALSDRPFEYRLAGETSAPVERTQDGRIRRRKDYDVEFFVPGEYELPGAHVTFVDGRGSSADGLTGVEQGDERELVTGSFTVLVGDSLDESLSLADTDDLPIPPPVELPADPNVWRRHWWLGPVVGLVTLLVTILILRRLARRRSELAEAEIPAHEWARSMLAALAADDLISAGEVQEFHYRVSGVLRGYIERRFHLLAPEMTTEEFLTEASSDARFGDTHREGLQAFLTSCDVVKYALHRPDAAQCGETLEYASDYVEQTRMRDDESSGDGAAMAGGADQERGV